MRTTSLASALALALVAAPSVAWCQQPWPVAAQPMPPPPPPPPSGAMMLQPDGTLVPAQPQYVLAQPQYALTPPPPMADPVYGPERPSGGARAQIAILQGFNGATIGVSLAALA